MNPSGYINRAEGRASIAASCNPAVASKTRRLDWDAVQRMPLQAPCLGFGVSTFRGLWCIFRSSLEELGYLERIDGRLQIRQGKAQLVKSYLSRGKRLRSPTDSGEMIRPAPASGYDRMASACRRMSFHLSWPRFVSAGCQRSM